MKPRAPRLGEKPGKRVRPGCALLLSLLLVSACVLVPPKPKPRPAPIPDPGLSGYAYTLASANSDKLELALAAARKDWKKKHTAWNRARLGLAYGQWGYSGYAPIVAAVHLRKALQQANDWPTYDRAFVQWRLAQLEYAAKRQHSEAAIAAENQQLQQQLREAREKLEAITEIERDLGTTQ